MLQDLTNTNGLSYSLIPSHGFEGRCILNRHPSSSNMKEHVFANTCSSPRPGPVMTAFH